MLARTSVPWVGGGCTSQLLFKLLFSVEGSERLCALSLA